METLELIKNIEKKENVEVLIAVEAGSRAWGFASPDSDYDIRFIYKKELEFYLRLSNTKDTLDYPVNNFFDLGGWDIKKACMLLWKSNMPLFEWIWSPIVYKSNPKFLAELQDLSHFYFSPAAAFHHYNSMAVKYIELCSVEDIKLKHLFYALRAVFATRWIIVNNSFPPVEFLQILNGIPERENFIDSVNELMDLKIRTTEAYVHKLDNHFLQELVALSELNSGAEKTLKGHGGKVEHLDKFFINIVKS